MAESAPENVATEKNLPALPDEQRGSKEEKKSSSLSDSGSNASKSQHEAKDDVPTTAEAPPADSEAQQKSKPRPKVIISLFALCLAMFLAALDQAIISTALPTITRDLKATKGEYAWVGSIYLVVAAAFIPSWGKISDIFGRKPTLLAANAIFFCGSLICGLSINIPMLLAGRALQGVGAGGINILVNICISDLFSMRERGFYMGILGIVFAFASAIGPVLGGTFAEKVTWRWSFYINLPLDGLAFITLLRFLDLSTPKTPLKAGLQAIDWAGGLFVVGGTIMLLSGITIGGVLYPWSSATVICLLVFAAVSIALFVLVEWKWSRYPILPLRILQVRSNVAALTANFAHGLVFMAGTYYLPFYFQAVLGASPILSGVELLPYVLILSTMATVGGLFIKATGHYIPLMIVGLAFLTLGNGLFIDFGSHYQWARIILFQIIAGIGVGSLFQSPLVALQAHVVPGDIAAVTAAFGFTRHLAAALSVAVGGAILQNQIQDRAGAAVSSLSPEIVNSLRSGGLAASTSIVSRLSGNERQVMLVILTRSLRTVWTVFTVIAGLGLIAACFVRPKVLEKKHEEAKTGLEEMEKVRLAALKAKELVTVGRKGADEED